MEELLLGAEKRIEIGKSKVKDLRGKGFIPGVVYSEGKEAMALKMSRHELLQLIHHHRIENVVLNLKIKDDAKKGSRSCMIKEVQHDPVSGDIIHIDFNEISLTKAIKVNVPIVTKGESVGVKNEGGALEHILWEIEVECLPTDIPKNIEVDISALKIGDSIHIKDIAFPDKVKVFSDADAVVLSVAAPMKEEAAPVEGEEKLEPEVIKEKKPEAEAETEEKK
ncbi:MAG: 50S ribosomal protein L25 [Candidatus Omnitrophica bacterium]|jgi:large subunit ribosomal protein L25|nr:50S ribosomal protein L25 [Candidatus Omnitrophota bacterium]MDD5079903.1 50S ribosomal protein L25 [Candidatus Omnitrophota bacterium]